MELVNGLSALPALQIVVKRLLHQIVIEGNFLATAEVGHHAGAFGHALQLFAHIAALNVVVLFIQINGFIDGGKRL
jgi:hypothetical protein